MSPRCPPDSVCDLLLLTGLLGRDMTRSKHYEPAPTEQLLRKREVAEQLRISTRTVERLIASGDLLPVRLGGSVRIRVEDVRELVERSRGKAVP